MVVSSPAVHREATVLAFPAIKVPQESLCVAMVDSVDAAASEVEITEVEITEVEIPAETSVVEVGEAVAASGIEALAMTGEDTADSTVVVEISADVEAEGTAVVIR